VGHEKFSLHTDELGDYASRNSQVSSDITSAANTHLGGLSVSPTMFGDLGHETGMHQTLSGHVSDLHGHVHKIAGHVRNLGEAVLGAQGDYLANEETVAESYRRIDQH